MLPGIRPVSGADPRKLRMARVGPRLASRPCMSQSKPSKGAIVVVGGSGGMSARYREIIEERGHELRHFENRVPNGTANVLGKVAAVIIMVGMVSHSLRNQVKSLVPEGAPVVYLRTASVSALRNAVDHLPSDDPKTPGPGPRTLR